MTDPHSSLESTSVAVILAQRSRADRDALLDDLAAMLVLVPGVQIERTLLRRRVTAVRLPAGGYVYALKKGRNGAFEAVRQQEVRGVVVRTVPMEIEAFLAELGAALDEELRRTEAGRAALQQWMKSV